MPAVVSLKTRSLRRPRARADEVAEDGEHTSKLEELDVEGILAFAERVLPRTADLWVHATRSTTEPYSNCSSRWASYSTEGLCVPP